MLWKGREEKLDVISLWCAIPMYVRGFFPKAAYSVLRKIEQLTNIKLDLKDLEEKAEYFREQIESEAMIQPQLRDIIEALTRRNREKEPTYIF
jgi:proteasome assembly chaperone (PAC2) family protein